MRRCSAGAPARANAAHEFLCARQCALPASRRKNRDAIAGAEPPALGPQTPVGSPPGRTPLAPGRKDGPSDCGFHHRYALEEAVHVLLSRRDLVAAVRLGYVPDGGRFVDGERRVGSSRARERWPRRTDRARSAQRPRPSSRSGSSTRSGRPCARCPCAGDTTGSLGQPSPTPAARLLERPSRRVVDPARRRRSAGSSSDARMHADSMAHRSLARQLHGRGARPIVRVP